MPDDPDPIEPGSLGTVWGGCERIGAMSGQVWVTWDSGRTLNLIEGVDTWEVVS
jgi:hypothetical protein